MSYSFQTARAASPEGRARSRIFSSAPGPRRWYGYALPAVAAVGLGLWVGAVTPNLLSADKLEVSADDEAAGYPTSLFAVQTGERTAVQ